MTPPARTPIRAGEPTSSDLLRTVAGRDGAPVWLEVLDGNPAVRSLFDRHYSRRAKRDPRGYFVGPGERLVLITPCQRAMFIWRLERHRRDGQSGVVCAAFRNEGAGLSSELIRAADRLADRRWPGERHFTHVDAKAIRSTNPGFCFKKAGWRQCGITKARGLMILERPPRTPLPAALADIGAATSGRVPCGSHGTRPLSGRAA